MAKVILSGHIEVSQADLATVQAELPTHVALTRAEPGCLTFEVTQDLDRPSRFRVYEEFADEAAFTAHQQRVKASRWGAATRKVSRHYTVTGEKHQPPD